ncbi:DUF6461 domain-containing protein [Nocardia jiangxiensis]|uniref:DUF6461 domain-containing protein n=1 Tax=Nocardia jiangxiensis TaxID=282685 RepID=A0ABW6RZQ3_9NOCA|nr:hypothetical protein [Nocardia jiangxiensis]
MPAPYFSPDQLDETGCPTWLSALAGQEHDPNHLVHLVRDLEPADALAVLGVDREDIRPCVLPTRSPDDQASLARAAIDPLNPTVVLIAGRVGDWTFIYDDLGETGYLWQLEQRPPVETVSALSTAGAVAATSSVAMTGHINFSYAVDGETLFYHSGDESDLDDPDEVPAEMRAVAEAAGTVDAEFDDGITMRMICALGGLPRTLDELREIPLVIAPYDSRPELFRKPSLTLTPQPYPFR